MRKSRIDTGISLSVYCISAMQNCRSYIDVSKHITVKTHLLKSADCEAGDVLSWPSSNNCCSSSVRVYIYIYIYIEMIGLQGVPSIHAERDWMARVERFARVHGRDALNATASYYNRNIRMHDG